MEEEGDQDLEDVITEDHSRFSDAEPAELKFKLEEEDKNSNIKKDSNADENRLREACRLLGHPSKISTYFSLSSPLLAHCTCCNAQFSGETSNDAVRKVLNSYFCFLAANIELIFVSGDRPCTCSPSSLPCL